MDASIIANDYADELRSLVVNDKVRVSSLTMVAEEYAANDRVVDAIVCVIITRIKTALGNEGGVAICLVDSICKNISGSLYKRSFAPVIGDAFLQAYTSGDLAMRKLLGRILETWTAIFGYGFVMEIQGKMKMVSNAYMAIPQRSVTPPQRVGMSGMPMTDSLQSNNISMYSQPQPSIITSLLQKIGPGVIKPSTWTGSNSGMTQSGVFPTPYSETGNGFMYNPSNLPSGITDINALAMHDPRRKQPEKSVYVAGTDLDYALAAIAVIQRPEALKDRRDFIIYDLYDAMTLQCSTCGFRFRESEKLDDHKTWHFHNPKRIGLSSTINDGSAPRSRGWFFTLDEWNRSTNSLTSDSSQPSFFEVTSSANQKRDGAKSDRNGKKGDISSKGHEGATCMVCGDKFEEFWDDIREDWILDGAVEVAPPVKGLAHEQCLGEGNSLPASMSFIVDQNPSNSVSDVASDYDVGALEQSNDNDLSGVPGYSDDSGDDLGEDVVVTQSSMGYSNNDNDNEIAEARFSPDPPSEDNTDSEGGGPPFKRARFD